MPLSPSAATESARPFADEAGGDTEEAPLKPLAYNVFLSLDHAERPEVEHRLLRAVQWTSNLCGLNGLESKHALLTFVERFLDRPATGGQDDIVGRLYCYGLPALEELCERLDSRTVAWPECLRLLQMFVGKLKDHPDPSSLLLRAVREHALEPGLTGTEHARLEQAASHVVQTAVKAQAAMVFEGTGQSLQQRAWECAATRALCETLGAAPPEPRPDMEAVPSGCTDLLNMSTDSLHGLLLRIREAEALTLGRPRPKTLSAPPQVRPRALPAPPKPLAMTPAAVAPPVTPPVAPPVALPVTLPRSAPAAPEAAPTVGPLNRAVQTGARRLFDCARQWGVEPGLGLDRCVARFIDQRPRGGVDDAAGNLHRFGLKALHRLCDRMATCSDSGQVKRGLGELFANLDADKEPSATFLHALHQLGPDSGSRRVEQHVPQAVRAHFIRVQMSLRAQRVMADRPVRDREQVKGLAERRLRELLGVSPPSAGPADASVVEAVNTLFPTTALNLHNMLEAMQEHVAKVTGAPLSLAVQPSDA